MVLLRWYTDWVSTYFTKEFWAATLERAIKTAAQAALGSGVLQVTDVWNIDWAQFGWFVLAATIASVLMSIASVSVGNNGPSLATETLTPEVVVNDDAG